jgi:flavorubredoxin
MESTITEIAADTYRISTFHPGYKMQFNQFLVKDDEPLLVHTAFRKMFPVTRDAVARVIDPASVRWIGFSHGSTFTGDGGAAIRALARVIGDTLGPHPAR